MKIDGGWYIKPKAKDFRNRIGAGGVIVRKNKILVCLVKDDGRKDYIFPKGGTENGETPLETAKREIMEETGLYDLKLIVELGVKERLTYKKTTGPKCTISCLLPNRLMVKQLIR